MFSTKNSILLIHFFSYGYFHVQFLNLYTNKDNLICQNFKNWLFHLFSFKKEEESQVFCPECGGCYLSPLILFLYLSTSNICSIFTTLIYICPFTHPYNPWRPSVTPQLLLLSSSHQIVISWIQILDPAAQLFVSSRYT